MAKETRRPKTSTREDACLPNELLFKIMEGLENNRWKASLLQFGLANRTCYAFALPRLLLREVDLDGEQRHFLNDALALEMDKFALV